ncbi:Lrp/AsnC family transcriptional regulator [Candidatus Woesearchaeota archaeon]|nr:Lrp/AsnC family transcriptional regulator [Candidatus Woesearchaeota archaeon]
MLDKIDKQILQELELNGRQSSSKIAKKLKLNKAVVNYRIGRLLKRKIITGFSYLSNQVILGKLSFGLLLQLKNISHNEEEKIIRKLEIIESVAWVKSITGTWDLILVIIEKDLSSFIAVLNQIFSSIGKQIKNHNFYVDYEGGIKGHDYLYDTSRNLLVKYEKDNLVELKDIEKRILNELKKEPRISLLNIAHKLDKSYDTIKAKYSLLKSKKILLRCTPNINITELGYQEHLCFFNLSPDQEKNNKLIESCLKKQNITRYSKCLGHFNLIINIHTKEDKELKEIIYSLKKEYSEIINSCELIKTK